MKGDAGIGTMLKELGVSADELRNRIEAIIGHGDHHPAWDHIPFTPPAQHLLDRSFREMQNMWGVNTSIQVTCFALIHDGDNYGARVLHGLLQRCVRQDGSKLRGEAGKIIQHKAALTV